MKVLLVGLTARINLRRFRNDDTLCSELSISFSLFCSENVETRMKLWVTQDSKYAATIEAESRTVSVVPVDDLTGGMWRPLIFYGNVTHAATRSTHCVNSRRIWEGFTHIFYITLIIYNTCTAIANRCFFKTNRWKRWLLTLLTRLITHRISTSSFEKILCERSHSNACRAFPHWRHTCA